MSDDFRDKGGSPWGGISIDTKNNLLFLTTGNPRPALLGSSRKGPNKNANSIIAIDLIKKKTLLEKRRFFLIKSPFSSYSNIRCKLRREEKGVTLRDLAQESKYC